MHPAVLRGGDREEDRVDRRSLDGLRGEGSLRETGASSKKIEKKGEEKGKKGEIKDIEAGARGATWSTAMASTTRCKSSTAT